MHNHTHNINVSEKQKEKRYVCIQKKKKKKDRLNKIRKNKQNINTYTNCIELQWPQNISYNFFFSMQ